MQNRSLGLIETWGYTAAVEAVDAACKAARVLFVGHDRIGTGFITVKFSGDVAAVQAAVTAGAAAAQRVGRVISVHVIPRPHGQLGALGPDFPGIPGKGTEPGFAGGLPAAGDLPLESTDMGGVSEPVLPVQPGVERDKPAEDEHPRRRVKAKRAGAREASGTKDSKTAGRPKKPEK